MTETFFGENTEENVSSMTILLSILFWLNLFVRSQNPLHPTIPIFTNKTSQLKRPLEIVLTMENHEPFAPSSNITASIEPTFPEFPEKLG